MVELKAKPKPPPRKGFGTKPFTPSSRWLPAFRTFASMVTVISKETKTPGPIEFYTAQNLALQAMEEGLSKNARHFVFLKARQLGLSTLFLLLDIFWLYVHPGMRGAFVCDTESNREQFREKIRQMMDSLPPGFKIPIIKHDRNMMVLANGSSLQYMSAGTRNNKSLGRSRDINFLHSTELSSWGDPKGYDTLMDALATENPNRLYIFESTALGYNLFYDCWQDAISDDLGKRAVFIGWWAKEPYRFDRRSPEFDKWWNSFPEYMPDEAEVTLQVKQRFGHEITPEQWAWYRWKGDGRPEQSLLEEYPHLPEVAFQESGSPFFSARRINNDVQFIRAASLTFEGYRYEMRENFLQMRLRKANDVEEVQFRVWERPQPGAKYVIGVDPAYGSSEEADRTCLSVWRCFADKLVQVAEYASPLTTTQNCAWVLAHIAGEYRDCMINLELQGGGGEVMMELRHLRKSIQMGNLQSAARDMKLEHILDSARWFLWRKPDAMNGIPTVWNFKSSQDNKIMGLNRLNDAYGSGQLVIRSLLLLDEMNTLKRDGDKIGASGRNKDDRVMAAMLANYAWREWIQEPMMGLGRTYDREMREQQDRVMRGGDILNQIVPTFLADQRKERSDDMLKRLLEGPLDDLH